MKGWSLALILLAGCKGCAGCRATSVTETSDTADSADTSREETGESGTPLPPRCAMFEVEPNDGPSEAEPLAWEKRACGAFGKPLDLDMFTFEVTGNAWIGVYGEGEAIGSKADPTLVLISEDNETAEYRGDDGQRDAHLRFPATPGTYTLMFAEELGLGEEVGYEWELLVTKIKEPVTWTSVEAEPNDDTAKAHRVKSGERWFGDVADTFDSDWYRVDVPPGKHVLVVDVDAAEYGSAANFKVVVWDQALIRKATRYFGEQGWERDPYLEYTSPGGEALFVQIAELNSRGGRPYWYVVDFAVEGG